MHLDSYSLKFMERHEDAMGLVAAIGDSARRVLAQPARELLAQRGEGMVSASFTVVEAGGMWGSRTRPRFHKL
jgi:hypothetical protein